MKLHLARLAGALVALLAVRSAAALSITMEGAAPVPIGQVQTFRVAGVTDSVGPVTFTWDFGDGASPAPPSSSLTVSHTYAQAGHYTVIVQAKDSNASVTASFVQTAHNPLMAVPPRNSSSILFDAQHHQ